MKITQAQIKDIFEWDIVNWSRCSSLFSPSLSQDHTLDVLELGGRRGGMSLWAALHGHDVICSDLEMPDESAQQLHETHGVTDQIRYEAINALAIPYNERFDRVLFKSVLGGASRSGRDEHKALVIEQVYAALKPGGELLFAENLSASSLHIFLRKKFIPWGGQWNYLKYGELAPLLHSFTSVEYRTVGFFGTFGRTEGQRNFLGRIDKMTDWILPASMRYIAFVRAIK